MFNINDYIVYKGDVSVISDIKIIRDNKYYIIYLLNDSSLKINLPIDSKFIRSLVSYEDAVNLIESIPKFNVVNAGNDKALEICYKKLLNSDVLEDLVVILKTTYLRNKKRLDNGKKVGLVDTTYYDEASKKLFLELSISMNLNIDVIENILIEQFNK